MSNLFDTIRIIRKINQPDDDKIENVVNSINAFIEKTKNVTLASEKTINNKTLFIGIGGDGTSMRAARQAASVQGLVLGINCGNLGFLAEFDANNVTQLLTSLYKNKPECFIQEKRHVLVGCVHSKIDKSLAVNEFYITSVSKTCIEYSLYVDGEPAAVKQRADGVIIASPTGSTAYSLAAGGSIIFPQCNVMQVVPVAPHTLTSRPLIVPTNVDISIVVDMDQDVQLMVDGQKVPFPLNDDGKHVITISANQRKYFNFVKSTSRDHDFFKIIAEKLH